MHFGGLGPLKNLVKYSIEIKYTCTIETLRVRAHIWEAPNAWCRCVHPAVQPAAPDVTPMTQGFIGAGQEGLHLYQTK